VFGKTLTTVQTEDSFKLYLLPARELRNEREIALTPRGPAYDFAWEDDDSLILTDSRYLFRLNERGERRVILNESSQYSPGQPAPCRTEPYIGFVSEDPKATTGNANLLRIDKTTGVILKLAEVDVNHILGSPVCAPNGKWIYFVRFGTSTSLQRVAIDGSSTKTLSSVPMLPGIDVSRDGNLLAFSIGDAIGVVNTETGQVAKKLPIAPVFKGPRLQFPRFTPDNKSLALITEIDGIDNIWV